MSFYRKIEQYRDVDLEDFFSKVTPQDIERILEKDKLGELDFLALLSEQAARYLEPMAQKARQLTIQYFGRTIQLYIPLYISNYCTNECIYCGFNRSNAIDRRKLSLREIEIEAKAIAQSGMQHILLLAGEAKAVTPLDYLEEAVKILSKYFASVAIEIFPMDEPEYRCLKQAGVDGLTLYQEVYDEKIYSRVHLHGKKTDYRYRLDAPERGARAGFRSVNIGPLLGLGENRSEIFLAGLHAKYLDDRFLETEIGLSLPRFNPAEGAFTPEDVVDDRGFVQFLTALRLFLPRCGIAISTRERAAFRDRLMHLGPTRFSAGSCTGVGGYAENGKKGTSQFEITDERSVDEVVAAIRAQGYQPVYKDWDVIQ
jgi:2-iminoacetate synthase